MPEGRQSPPPSEQTGDQLGKPPGEDTKHGIQSDEQVVKKAKATLNNLESNPKHILQNHSEETTSKK
jgi:hypothetical protein